MGRGVDVRSDKFICLDAGRGVGMAHGVIVDGSRKCDVHGDHGILYPCPEYGAETLKEIEEMSLDYIGNLKSPKWRQEQMANGISEEGLGILMAMAGIKIGDWGTEEVEDGAGGTRKKRTFRARLMPDRF